MRLFPWLVAINKSLNLAKARSSRRALVRSESLEPRMLLTITAGFTGATEYTISTDDSSDSLEVTLDENGFITVNGVSDPAADASMIDALIVDASGAVDTDGDGVFIDLSGLAQIGTAIDEVCGSIHIIGSDVDFERAFRLIRGETRGCEGKTRRQIQADHLHIALEVGPMTHNACGCLQRRAGGDG